MNRCHHSSQPIRSGAEPLPSGEACRWNSLQRKLTLGSTNDPLEMEADRVSGHVMAMPVYSGSGLSMPGIQRLQPVSEAQGTTAPASFGETVAGPGLPLEARLRSGMERRFGHDFSRVRVHTDAGASRSAREVNAQAYTVGSHIVIGEGRFTPSSLSGQHLIAHELAHVIQQSSTTRVQRFSDVDHHVVEAAALKRLFTEEQLKALETGNMHRDYSQLPAWLNGLLLGQSTRFGGYKEHEHFDNFVFDRATDRWVSQEDFEKIWDDHSRSWVKRTVPPASKSRQPRVTAPQYIEAQLLVAVQKDMPDGVAFEHIGNAFHTIEDFFAHSNFVELMQGDRSHGDELATHSSHAHGPASEESIQATVSDQATSEYLSNKFEQHQEAASPLSHGSLAKEFHGNPNHGLAMTLAALVVQQVALALKNVFVLGTQEARARAVRETIMTTLSRYFRPPSEQDKWWQTLLSEDNGLMSRRIKALQRETPVTVNQTPSSPLRNIEATRFSPMKAIGMGTSLSFSLGDRQFLTTGAMLNLPGTGAVPLKDALELPSHLTDREAKPSFMMGLQVDGSFDETKWFEK